MNKPLTVLSIATLCLGLLLAPNVMQTPASADGTAQIRFATLAPKGSKAERILRAWDLSVKEKTGGKVSFQFYSALGMGDERTLLNKMDARANQLDAATFTSIGLGQVVRSASVLQVPGMFKSYKDLSAVRTAMDSEWRKSFDDAGYQLLGWFDIGFGRIFSTQPIAQPSDLKKARPWVWRDDIVFPELLKIVGANGVALGLGEVTTALSTKMIDTVIASPTAALGLQWFNSLKYMTKQADIALVGATLITNQRFKSLPPDAQQILVSTGKQAHEKALQLIATEEQADYNSLKARGIQEVDTAPHAAAWNKAYLELRTKLSGKLFSKDLLDRVLAAVSKAEGK
ncbi:MAG: TRAP-type C4-dicarboxylate transport system, periplasmic component [Myxococcaceae bacterium]|nr:TRAP-type C4-dicarboxylate transport system, periplasmic component [Myxococcaceae bacterium]